MAMGFSNITAKLFMLEGNFCLFEIQISLGRIFSTLRKIAATIFSQIITKNMDKMVEFKQNPQTLKNNYLRGPKGNRI